MKNTTTANKLKSALKRGFTLTEVAIVIVLLGVAAAVFVARMKTVSTNKLAASSVAEQMVGICAKARQVGSRTQITDLEAAYNAYLNGITLTGPLGKEVIEGSGSQDGAKICDLDIVQTYYDWDATNRTVIPKTN